MSYPPTPSLPQLPPGPGADSSQMGDGAEPASYLRVPLNDLLVPARRVAVLMFVMGVLAILLAGLLGLMLMMLSSPKIRESPGFAETMEKVGDEGMFRLGLGIWLSVFLLYGVVTIALAFFVRRGGLTALLIALVGTILVGVPSVGVFLLSLLTFNPLNVVVPGLIVVLMVLQAVGLGHAMTRAGAVEQWQTYLAGRPAPPIARWHPHAATESPLPGSGGSGATGSPYDLPPAPPPR